MRLLFCIAVCLLPSVAYGQDVQLAIGAEPTTTGGLESRVVVEQLAPALPRVSDCYRDRAETPLPLRLSFDTAGAPTVLGRPGTQADCLHTAVANMRVGVAPAGSRRMALIRLVVFGREVVPLARPEPSPPRAENDDDVGLIVGLTLGAAALVGSAMMLGSTGLVEEHRGALFWPGFVLAAPGLVVVGVILLIQVALED